MNTHHLLRDDLAKALYLECILKENHQYLIEAPCSVLKDAIIYKYYNGLNDFV